MNDTVSYDVFTQHVAENLPPTHGFLFGNMVHLFKGKPVLYCQDNIVLFDNCEYCGTTEIPVQGLYNSYVCAKCGAPITGA